MGSYDLITVGTQFPQVQFINEAAREDGISHIFDEREALFAALKMNNIEITSLRKISNVFNELDDDMADRIRTGADTLRQFADMMASGPALRLGEVRLYFRDQALRAYGRLVAGEKLEKHHVNSFSNMKTLYTNEMDYEKDLNKDGIVSVEEEMLAYLKSNPDASIAEAVSTVKHEFQSRLAPKSDVNKSWMDEYGWGAAGIFGGHIAVGMVDNTPMFFLDNFTSH